LINCELLTDLDSIGDYTDDAVESMAKRVDHPGDGHISFGIGRITKFKAVAFWVQKQRREGATVTIDRLDTDVICDTI
jgi:hypothetical protein